MNSVNKLLLFGGTFDPPHMGHIDLLRNAINCVEPDLVVVMPAGIPPHKSAGVAPASLRYAMCASFKPLFTPLVVSDIEINRRGRSYTLQTVRQLQKKYRGAAIYLSIGGDMLLSFTQWHRYKLLLQEVTLVVQRREHNQPELEKAAKKLRDEGAHILFAEGETRPLSSSAIRKGLEAGEDMYPSIPSPAKEIVMQYDLYQRYRKAPNDC